MTAASPAGTERVGGLAWDIVSGGSPSTVATLDLGDGIRPFVALHVIHGIDDSGDAGADDRAKLIGIASGIVNKLKFDPKKNVEIEVNVPAMFIEEHGQDAVPLATHAHEAGACWSFRLDSDDDTLHCEKGLARFASSEGLAPYVAGLLQDTFLRPHTETLDPFNPGMASNSSAIRRLDFFMRGEGAFFHPALVAAGRLALHRARARGKTTNRLFF